MNTVLLADFLSLFLLSFLFVRRKQIENLWMLLALSICSNAQVGAINNDDKMNFHKQRDRIDIAYKIKRHEQAQ